MNSNKRIGAKSFLDSRHKNSETDFSSGKCPPIGYDVSLKGDRYGLGPKGTQDHRHPYPEVNGEIMRIGNKKETITPGIDRTGTTGRIDNMNYEKAGKSTGLIIPDAEGESEFHLN